MQTYVFTDGADGTAIVTGAASGISALATRASQRT